jgi:ribosome-binding protein aMBF1 (putative translation factor)
MSRQTMSATEILKHRYYAGKPERKADLDVARLGASVARQIYELRSIAGLTQRELALQLGTTTSVISRLEDADYQGYSLQMLRRIATALGASLEVKLVPVSK